MKTIEDCANCKDKEVGRNSFDELRKSIDKVGKKHYLDIVRDLFKTNVRLNKEVLCEGCKGKEIRKLVDKRGNEEIAKLLYECRLNRKRYDDDYVQRIPFDEFKNIEYLAKGGFGEVYKATWINVNGYYSGKRKCEDEEVVLKRIYNSSDKTVDILSEVK